MGVDDLAKYSKKHCIGEKKDLIKPLSGLSINEKRSIDLSVFIYRWKGNDAALDLIWGEPKLSTPGLTADIKTI